MKFNMFSTFVERLRSVPWRSIFENTRQLNRFFIRICLVVTGSVSRETAIVCVLVARKTLRLYRTSGPLFSALYMKQCGTQLMRYYAGSTIGEGTMSGTFISLSRSGIPTVIPVHHRQIIQKGGDRADFLVRLYLSLFTIGRIVALAKPVTSATFKSIVDPISDMGKVQDIMGEVKENFSSFISTYMPWVPSIPLIKGFEFVPSWKTVPNEESIIAPILQQEDKRRGHSTPVTKDKVENCFFTSMKYEIAAFARQLRVIHSWQDGIWSPAVLFQAGFILYPMDTKFNTWVTNEGLRFYESWAGPMFDTLATGFGDTPLYTGRLAQSYEGAGKRRLFVIGNWFKQRLLHPVHVWAMSVLRRIPQDGTYEQEAPIHLLSKSSPQFLASFDLSSATDRWPVPLIHDIVSCFWSPSLASAIVNGALACNTCSISGLLKYKKKSDRKRHEVVFQAGQPLGYYGSWALFSLSHHCIVWLAAKRAYPHRKNWAFRGYALLGDDIVISDRRVATEYRSLLDSLQVSISEAKSIVSETGCLEFAKKFYVKGVQKNLSPISSKAVLHSYTLSGIHQLSYKYKLSSKTCLRLNGAGYRVLGKMDTPQLSIKFKRVKALSDRRLVSQHDSTIRFWLGRGLPLSPYLMGELVQMAKDKVRLKQLTIPDPGKYWGDGEVWITENTAYRHWMTDWLKYLQWFVTITNCPNPRLEDFFCAPVVPSTYRKRDLEKQQFTRSWSMLYTMYDWAEGKSSGYCPPCLTGGYPLLEEPSIVFARSVTDNYNRDQPDLDHHI